MTGSVWFWTALVCLAGALVGALDRWVGLSYGVELLSTALVVAAVLPLSHRYAGIPR